MSEPTDPIEQLRAASRPLAYNTRDVAGEYLPAHVIPLADAERTVRDLIIEREEKCGVLDCNEPRHVIHLDYCQMHKPAVQPLVTTVEQAVSVLNKQKWRGQDGWKFTPNGSRVYSQVHQVNRVRGSYYDTMTIEAQDAIAIANWLQVRGTE